MKETVLAACLVLLTAACGSDSSASEYAESLDVWANDVDSRLDSGSVEYTSRPASIEGTRDYLPWIPPEMKEVVSIALGCPD